MHNEEFNEIEQGIIAEEQKKWQSINLKKSLISVSLIAVIGLGGIGGYRQVAKNDPKSDLFYSKPPSERQWAELFGEDISHTNHQTPAISEIVDGAELANHINEEVIKHITINIGGRGFGLVATVGNTPEEATISMTPLDNSGEDLTVVTINSREYSVKNEREVIFRVVFGVIIHDYEYLHPNSQIGSIGGGKVGDGIVGLYTEKGGELITNYRMKLDGKNIYLKDTGKR